MDIEQIRKMVIDAMRGDDYPEMVVMPEDALRRHFGDQVVDAAFADGIATYLTEDEL